MYPVHGLAWVLLWQEVATVIFQLGEIYTIFGIYLLLRCLIRNRDDIVITIRTFAYIATVIALVMIYEHAVGSNPYALLGGTRAAFYASATVRENGIRAAGSFAHAITAGTFAAVCSRCLPRCGGPIRGVAQVRWSEWLQRL